MIDIGNQLLCLLLVISLGITQLWAQRVVTGKVTNDQGAGLPGVNIVVTGTLQGTVSGLDGNYSIAVPQGASLTFSFIGFQDKQLEVGHQSVIDVSLTADVRQLGEIVITAIGVEKERKALPYSVTEIQSSGFVEAREINLADALSGKVAGVNVSDIGSGVGGSSRVIIRGNTSIAGNNQPLYIVDGVPMDNSQLGQAGMWGGSDFGDGTNSVNPDDIEAISVLKGNTAAALYGSRAANGVLLITTKKGSRRKGIGVEISSNVTFERINNLFDFQTEYGHGFSGIAPTTPEEGLQYGNWAWGERLDASLVYQFDGVQRPYSYTGDNHDKFYRTGSTITNGIALTGGSNKQTFRFSASDLRNQSVTPNSGMNRQNFSLSTNANWVEKLILSAKLLYSREDVKNRSRISDSPGNENYTLSVLPPSINVLELQGTTEKLGAKEDGTELQYSPNIFTQNPYWAAYQYSTDDLRDRILGSAQLRYDILDWLYLQGRIGMDWYTDRRTVITPYGTGGGRGGMQEFEIRVSEINWEFMLGGDYTFGDFRVNGFMGGNRMRRSFEVLGASVGNFNIPFFHTLSNAANQTIVYFLSEKGINSLYGSVELSYKNIIFLTATGRNDWFSTLSPDNNSIFYPSVGATFVFSDAFDAPGWLTFGKLRGSWAEVGGDTDPYQTSLTYSLEGQGHMGVALGRITQGSIPNSGLQPLTVSEFEIGFDLGFFNNRLGIDYAYYNRKTVDDILNTSVSETTGYNAATVNVGEITNNGHELLITGTPFDRELRWDVTFNFAHNKTEVVQLVGDQKVFQAQEARSRNAFSQHRVEYIDENGVFYEGGYSMIVGRTHKMINGQKVYTVEGFPVQSDNVTVLGSGIHPYTMGLFNSLYFKNFDLRFLLDMKMGGDLYVGTNVQTVGNGHHKMTLEGRDYGINVLGVDESGAPLSVTVPAANVQDYWLRYNQIADYFVQSADFVKLRQIVLGYNFPKSLISNTPFNTIRLSLVGRNLWLIHSEIDNVDPEQTYNGSNGQGLEWFGVPQSRSYGFNVNLIF